MMGHLSLPGMAILSLLGCLALAMSQTRNRRRVLGHQRAHTAPSWLTPAGWCLLGISLWICVLRDGASFAAVLWPLSVASSSFVVAMAIAFMPKGLRWILSGNSN